MDGLLVCGGKGSRLGPLGALVNKTLLPVSGGPILKHAVQVLVEDLGCDRLVFATGHLGDQVRKYVASEGEFGVECTFYDDADTTSTFGAVQEIIHTLTSKFAYSHGNIVLSPEGRQKFKHSFLDDPHRSHIAMSLSDFAPTHPHISHQNQAVTGVGRRSSSYPICAVGLAVFDVEAFQSDPDQGQSEGPVESFISKSYIEKGKLRAVDIGSSWMHLEDMSFYDSLKLEAAASDD